MNLDLHNYAVELSWSGNRGTGTSGYRDYGRDHVLRARGLPELPGTADPTFHGDRDRWNPEQLLLGALAQCHMLSFLHLAVRHSIVVTGYTDAATATLRLNRDGSGEFTEAVLHPDVALADESQRAAADALHAQAHEVCFIARSVNFPVRNQPVRNQPVRNQPVPRTGTGHAAGAASAAPAATGIEGSAGQATAEPTTGG